MDDNPHRTDDDSRKPGDQNRTRGILGDPWRLENPDWNLFAWKCAMLLLGQNLWINRRVETVSFTAQGTTRRQMSFDFTLPPDKTIYWRDQSSPERLAAVPLTFLGKGDLIHVDARDASGNTVPIARFGENKEFTGRALDYCFRQLDDADRIEEDVRAICRNEYRMPEKKVNYAIKNGHDGIACLPIDDPDSIEWMKRRISAWLRMLYGEDVSAEESLPIDLGSNPLLDKDQTKWELDINRCVVALVNRIGEYVRARIKDGAGAAADPAREGDGQIPGWRVRLETYLLLLSACCDMYACVVLLPEDCVAGRSIVKLSFDSSYQESPWDRYAFPNSEQLRLAFQTSSAQSTHIEINPIAGSRIASVKWDLRGDRQTRIRSSVAAGRIHISMNYARNIPLVRLHMTMLNSLPAICANVGWSLLFSACAVANVCFVLGWLPEAAEYYGTENVLAVLALLLTLWVARRINAINHSLSQDLSRYPGILVSANLTAASLSCLLCGLSGSGAIPAMLQRAVCACCVVSLALTGVIAHGLLVWARFRRGVTGVCLKTAENESYEGREIRSRNETRNERRISFLVDSGTVPLPQFNGDYVTEPRRKRRCPVDDRNDYSRNASLYPADHGPYSIIERLRSDHRLSAMRNKLSYVARRWKRDR